MNLIENLRATASTLDQLVTFLTKERSKGDQAIKDILLSSHPAFAAIKKAAAIQYRVVFYTLQELEALLGARGYVLDPLVEGDRHEWDNPTLKKGIRVKASIFDNNGRLRIFTPEEWDKENVVEYPIEPKKKAEAESDEVPF